LIKFLKRIDLLKIITKNEKQADDITIICLLYNKITMPAGL